MANFLICSVVFRIVLPVIFLSCIIFRPCLISAIYLFLLLISASVPVPTRASLSGATGLYLKLLILISTLMLSLQVVFQSLMLLEFKPYGSILKNCEFLERILRHAGFVRLDHMDVLNTIIWVTPEVTMFVGSIVFYVVLGRLAKPPIMSDPEEDVGRGIVGEMYKTDGDGRAKKQNHKIFVALGKYLVIVALCIAAIMKPSVPGGFYFLVFLCSTTWWSCYKNLEKGFAVVMKFCMLVVFCHIFTLYAYQTDWPQEIIGSNSTYSRYFGLSPPLLTINCEHPRYFINTNSTWTDYVNLLALLFLYFVLAIESSQLLRPQPPKKQGTFSRLEGSFNRGPLSRQLSQRLSDRRLRRSATSRGRWQSATRKVREKNDATNTGALSETTPLIHSVGSPQRYGINVKGPAILQDSTGSVIVAGENADEIPLKEVNNHFIEEEEPPTCFEQFVYVLESILIFVIRTSYIGTNIIMMAWSITYHSWLTFVLLIWASILWLIPNQRKHMLRSSPFLVIYAWFLLVSAYAYSMNLTEDELPTIVDGIDLKQIGFVRITEMPCGALLVKCLYTAMFWITLRQYMKENREARQSSALADMVAPLQITVGTATGVDPKSRFLAEGQKYAKKVYPERAAAVYAASEQDFTDSTKPPSSGVSNEQAKDDEALVKIGTFVRKLLTKCWIWIVAITLFIVAITGQRMTSFRILYMLLFLIFILSFQFSFRFWRKMMFGFWLTVIIYSLIILVLIYTYQFDNFPTYWKDYLHVSEQQQLDIGLEKYETKQLFVRLVTPTFFVIITVVQLHYFHKDFLEISKPTQPNVADTTKSEANSSAQGGVQLEDESQLGEEDYDSERLDLTDLDNVPRKVVQKKFERFFHALYELFNLILLFLEIHMPKLVLLAIMLVCVKDVGAVYFGVVILIVLGATIGKNILSGVVYTSSLVAAILLIIRMIYQIDYIKHDMWNVTCLLDINNTYINVTSNNAEWLGLYKIDSERKLPELVKWNIIHILAVTFWCVLNVRQSNHRANIGLSPSRPFFIFPKIKVTNANKNLKNYMKYLANFLFYRMGVEMCMIAIVAVIGIRMDFYALLYGIWLCILFPMNRTTLAKVWNVFLIFVAVLIPIQYLNVVGMPPILCLSYPWDSNDILRRLQEWAFLMDPMSPPPAKKLLCDFTLLLFIARQSLVFRIERRHTGQDYIGGSNESTIHYAEDKTFTIPVPDFITYSRNYLDIVKKGTMLPFMWFTLAIVFLAGTNRVNLFSLGYLFGSFYFLWKGSDIYLRPIPKIIEKWNVLLGYNVFVIIVKVILQLVGCLFFDYIKDDACWLIQLLGISCLRKFKTSQPIPIPIPGQDECSVPREYIGLAWDGACFAFLLLQRRLFHSYNFFHIVNESKASAILASRGAELIEELRQKRMSEQDEAERKVIEKIKTKMDRIKATQQKILGPNYQGPSSHYVAQPPLARTSSMSSCTSATSQQTTTPAGYHTPIEEDPEPEPPQTPAASSLMQPNAPSPFSAINTGSLEGYLEPQRMSFSSPPNSELNPNRPQSPDDSFPVFSPPPYDDACTAGSEPTTVVQRQHSIGPPWRAGSLVTPRQSVISYSSRSPMSHHTYSIFPKSNRPLYRRKEPKSYKSAIRSGDYYMFDDMDQEDDLDVFEDVSSKDSDDEDQTRKRKQRTLSELLSSTLKSDVGTVMRSEYAPRRRVSLPPMKGEPAESQLSAPYSAPPAVRIDEISEYDPQPSTSKMEDDEEGKSTLQEKPPLSKSQTVVNLLLFVGAFINSFMISATNFLNKYTRDYRYVMRVLSREKKVLKETTEYSVGTRTGPDFVWQPSCSYKTLLLQSREGSLLDTPLVGTCSPSDSYRQGLYEPHTRMTEMFSSSSEKQPADSDESCTKAMAAGTPLPYSAERDRPRASISNIPEIRILAPSMERGLDSPGSAHQVNFIEEYECAEMSSYDQPAVVRLLLAMWYMVLSHSDLLCYFIIFLNQIKNATFISLPLPLMVFFWGTLTVPRPSKTFWITIIAYTQIIVIIKCMFQFQILPWNRGDYATYPFQATSLIGIERKKNYAVWDLLLLLVVFFHRFMLKCLGLWKTTFMPVAVLADGEYSIENGELVPHSTEQRHKQRDTRRSSDLEQLVDEESDSEEKVYLQSSQIEPKDILPSTIKLTLEKHGASLKLFFQQLFDPTSRVAADVYSYMFLCDFFNFFVIMIGYSSFGTQQGDGGVSSYLEDNRVPVLFLLMLIIQFLIIIVDRAIFLRKNIFAKIIFQFIQIFGLHIWLFVLFPIITERSVNSVVPPQTYYMVKCFYLLLSAYQIRCGYPARILGNFLCKAYNYFNMFSFKAFMMVPFLFELRTVMDWMWTDTSMTVFDWIKMEDIFAHIYQLKCTRHIEDEYPQPRGEKKKPLIKYFMGGGLLAVIIGIIWFPLVFFSLGNAVGEANPPYDVTIDLRLGPYEPLYRMSAQSNSIYKFTENDYLSLQQRYIKNKGASTFISNYDYEDVAAVKLSRYSGTVWSISPPDKKRMIDEVASENKLLLHMKYQVSHKSNSKEDPGVMWQEIVLEVDAQVDGKPNPIRQNLLAMLNHTEPPPAPILLTYIMPKFVKVTSRGTVQTITSLLEPYPDPKAASLRNITINLSEKDENSWWEIQEECDDLSYVNLLKYLPYADCNSFMMYTFNDKIFPATLSIITGGGIIGLYTTLVFVASRVLRGFFSEICFKIMFDDMPCVDRVYQLCLDIYLVREANEFCLEEDLFAKLVFLYRSPETLIKWTRPKEELGEDEDPEGDPDNN